MNLYLAFLCGATLGSVVVALLATWYFSGCSPMHQVRIWFNTSDGSHEARCSCGWVGGRRNGDVLAEIDANSHRLVDEAKP